MNNELMHYGVLGMKWGVRKDRSTVKVAKAKRKASNADLNNVKKVIDSGANLTNLTKAMTNNLAKPKHKQPNLKNMSDKELRDRVNRLNMERQYLMLTQNDNVKVSKGAAFASTVLDYAGTTLAITSSAVGLALAIRELKGKK